MNAAARLRQRPAVEWVTASPLWPDRVGDRDALHRPALVRFASDDFMEEFARLLADDPGSLASTLARPESFRVPPTGAGSDWSPPLNGLKLYQPVQGHFTLVAATLVCGIPGMPDRRIADADGERASFVLRRITDDGEFGWVEGATQRGWASLPPGRPKSLLPREERHPLFPVVFGDPARRRRLLAGLIPTSSREAFQAGPGLGPFAVDSEDGEVRDPRLGELGIRVVDALELLTDPDVTLSDALRVEASRFLLLDLADFLDARAPDAWTLLLKGPDPLPDEASDAVKSLHELLTDNNAGSGTTWLSAIRTAWKERLSIAGDDPVPPTLDVDLTEQSFGPEELGDAVAGVLPDFPDDPAERARLLSFAGVDAADVDVPKLEPGEGRYVVRCVYERPRCGPLGPDLVSEPSEPFTIASFFDPDAPARPIRISLPIDTSVRGLRGYRRNVGFLISDQLRSQMERVRSLKKALEGEVDEPPSFDLGMLCSLSIPIITICALILLMLIVYLLNFVFFWVPFLRVCFPIKLGGGDE